MVKGVVRNIDGLGRVVIPKEIRRSLKIGEFEPMDIYLQGDVICIRKPRTSCVCCGTEDEDILLMNKGVLLCPDCLKEFCQGVG